MKFRWLLAFSLAVGMASCQTGTDAHEEESPILQDVDLQISQDVPELQNGLSHVCETDDTFYHAPHFIYPEPEGWRHEREAGEAHPWQSCSFIQDTLVRENEAATVQGVFFHDCDPDRVLQDEWVQVYFWGTGMDDWIFLGRHLTDARGRLQLHLPPLPRGQYIVKAVVMGDASGANGYVSSLQPGTGAVAFFLDGAVARLSRDGTSASDPLDDTPVPYVMEVVRHYREHGYPVILLSARHPLFATRTRGWLASLEIPFQSMLFLHEIPESVSVEVLEAAWLMETADRAGIRLYRGYAASPAQARALLLAGIAPQNVFLLGPQADGGESVFRLRGDDYAAHWRELLWTERLECAVPGGD